MAPAIGRSPTGEGFAAFENYQFTAAQRELFEHALRIVARTGEECSGIYMAFDPSGSWKGLNYNDHGVILVNMGKFTKANAVAMTLVHELAHHYVRHHGLAFISKLQEMAGRLLD